MTLDYNYFPDGLPTQAYELSALEFLQFLERPTLVRVPGRGLQPPRAITTLLHGDESTGVGAILDVLRPHHTFDFDLFIVFGNVQAAIHPPPFSHRYLDGQEDFNRIWDLREPTTAQRLAADGIFARLSEAGLESLVDIHNNTGNNPFYAIVTNQDPKVLNLATLFTTTLLMWDLGAHTIMESVPDGVTAVAIECGLARRPESLAFAIDGIRRYLGEPALVDDRVTRDYDLFGDMRKVMVRPEVRFRFGGELDDQVDLIVDEDADHMNFRTVEPGHVIGHVRPGGAMPLVATAQDGLDVTDKHLAVDEAGRIHATTEFVPVMMTRTVEATRKDCLFYMSRPQPPYVS